MDNAYLILLLIFFFGPTILRMLGGGKKGPTGKKLPPVSTRPPRPSPRSARPARGERPEMGGRTQEEGPAWWDAPPEPAAAGEDRSSWQAQPPEPAPRPTPREDAATPVSGAGDEDRPWWEVQEDSGSASSPAPTTADPSWDEYDRPAGPVVRSPEDLWEILTGQRSPFPVPEAPPRPEPEPEPPIPARDDPRSPRRDPTLDVDVTSLEGESLEATEISSEGRHREFHRKIDRVVPSAPRTRAVVRLGLDERDDVRHAIVLAEVLGKPRSLAGPDW